MKTKSCRIKECVCKSNSEWLINSPEFGNCFWSYLIFNTRKHTLKETAELLGITISVVTSTEKRVISKLKRKLNNNK